MFLFRSKSSNLATLKMELFAAKVNVFQSLRIATKTFILVVAGLLDPPLFFVSSMEERLNRCFTISLPERLLHKSVNCIILHCFTLLMPTLSIGQETSAIIVYYANWYYHVKSSTFSRTHSRTNHTLALPSV